MQTPHPQSPDLTNGCRSTAGFNTLSVSNTRSVTTGDELCRDATVQSIPTDEPNTSGRRPQQLRGGSTGPGSGGGPAGSGSVNRHQSSIRWLPITRKRCRAQPTSYQSSPSQSVPQSQPAAAPPEANPWESAFNKVVGLLSQPAPSPFQGQPSTPTQAASSSYPGQLGTGGANQPGYQSIGSPDLVSQPGLLAQLFPSLFANFTGRRRHRFGPAGELEALKSPTTTGMSPKRPVMVLGRITVAEAPAILNQYALGLEADA